MMRTRGRGGRLLSKRNREDPFLNLLMQDVNHHSTSDSDSQNDMDEEHDISEKVNIEQVISEEVNIENGISEKVNIAQHDCLDPLLDQLESTNSDSKNEVERDEVGREILIIVGKCFISIAAPRSMLNCLRGWFNGVWPTFSEISDDVKQNFFNMFREKFTWRASTTEQQIYKIWKSYFSRIMTSEMRRIRKATKSAPPPTWMRKEIFEELWSIWVADKYKDLQANNRKNRISDRDGLGVVKSTAGSISIPHHAYRMAHANAGLSVPHENVFNRTHRTNKGRGPFVDKKSKKTFESYTLKLNEKQSQSNDTTILPSTNASSTYYPDLWIEASGGLKNGRCYGSDNSYNESVIYGTSSRTNAQIIIEKYKDRVEELEKLQMEMNNSFEQRVDNVVKDIVKNVVSTALEVHGIYQSHHFSPGQYSSPGSYTSSQFSAPGSGYFSAPVPGYYASPNYFRIPSHHLQAQYQAPNQDSSPVQRQSSDNGHCPDQLISRS